jgi:hypothetical protein
MTIKTIYMIRHKATGLYKLGGTGSDGRGAWSKKGKVWMGIGPLKLHVNLYKNWRTNEIPDHLIEEMKQWEIVAIRVSQEETHTFTIKQLYE